MPAFSLAKDSSMYQYRDSILAVGVSCLGMIWRPCTALTKENVSSVWLAISPTIQYADVFAKSL